MIAGSFRVRLTLEGPVMTQSTTQGTWGVDAMMAKSEGHYYLPGTLIKGLLGEAWQQLGCGDSTFAQARKTWLGVGSDKRQKEKEPEKKEQRDEPARGMLFFEDLIDSKPPADDARTLFRIEIDPERSSVRHGHYMVAEAPYKRGQRVAFEGTLWALGRDRADLEDVRKRVQTALRWIRAAGSERTIGFGQVSAEECDTIQALDWREDTGERSEQAFELELEFERPVCFAKRRVAGNLFESEEWITGAALKGALAMLLDLKRDWWPELRDNLHAIRFTHALPGPTDEKRATYPPESLVMGADDEVVDAIEWKEAPLDRSKLTFRLDWKKEPKKFWERYRWKKPERELRVRTAIEGDQRKAKDENLFAYRMMVPKDVVWRARVHFEGVEETERPKVAGQMAEALKHGLFAMGKTKAHAKVAPVKAWAADSPEIKGTRVAIMLQTAALLCVPDRCLAPNRETGSTDREKMWMEYKAVWQDLSAGALALENYFHRQSLAGGDYMRNRFQHGKTYKPYLLTEPGSVFMLEVRDPVRAKDCLAQWNTRGLPLTPQVRRFYDLGGVAEKDLWQHCPFLPENGFGEIAIHEPEAAHVQ